MRFSSVMACAAALLTASVAMAQSAILADGTVVTLKIDPATGGPIVLGVEGPLWDIDLVNKTATVAGMKWTVPRSVNGEIVTIGGTMKTNSKNTNLGEFTVDDLARMSDQRAITSSSTGGDVISTRVGNGGPIRSGAVRSQFSASEGAAPAGTASLDRWPTDGVTIQDNYFFQVRNAATQYPAGTLPTDFLGRVGFRTATGAYTTDTNIANRRNWRYPTTMGDTVTFQGSVYVGPNGQEYLIPDAPVKGFLVGWIHSENVAIAPLTARRLGNFNTPNSLVMGEMLLIMNQDPRMFTRLYGAGNADLNQDFFFTSAPIGTDIAVVGHMIGEHVMFGEDVNAASVVDPSAAVAIGLFDQNTQADLARSTVRFRGEVVGRPNGNFTVTAQFQVSNVPGSPTTGQSFNVPFVVDPLTGIAIMAPRLTGVNLAGVTTMKLTVRATGGNANAPALATLYYDLTPYFR